MIPLEPRPAANTGLTASSAWMEPVQLIEQLARAQRRVAETKRRIERQKGVISRLKSGKRDTRTAEALLRTFEATHAQLVAVVGRLRESVGTELSRAR